MAYHALMRVISVNVCGIRSAAAKGLFRWLRRQNADFICLQETRSHEDQLAGHDVQLPGYHGFFCDAERKGYAGVALYTRHRPQRVVRGFGVGEFDREGRYLEAQVGKLSVVSLYLPSGSAGPHRQASKFRFLDAFEDHLARLRRRRRHYILGGDWNIAHRAIDLTNWRSNQKNPGFLPEERAWMDRLFGPAGYVDAFREVRPEPGLYTWWSNRGQARAKNVGWRIDYQVVSADLAGRARAATIYKERRFSDHAARHGLRALSAPTLSATRAGGEPRLREVLASPKMLAILFLGAASGFPNHITESALQAWLKDAGVSAATIGVMSYVALPYLLKFLWAPLIDRYPLPWLCRRRGWILAMQVALALTIALFALQNPAVALTPISACAVAIVFFRSEERRVGKG